MEFIKSSGEKIRSNILDLRVGSSRMITLGKGEGMDRISAYNITEGFSWTWGGSMRIIIRAGLWILSMSNSQTELSMSNICHR